MNRRELFETLGGAVAAFWALPAGSAQALSIGRGVHAQLQNLAASGRYLFRSLDPHQNRTVGEIAELILPATDTPGAKAARVNEFIDLVLTEWMVADERRTFFEGLSRLDAASLERNGALFVDATEQQRVELLETQEREAIASRPEAELAEGAAAATVSPAARHFFDVVKWLTLVGYYTSDVGMDEELHHEVFPGSHSGCVPFDRG